ncbi:glycosyltransferase [Paenibacillus sp. P96]|uniref:Glycosyltransferase n=1 Tax=Paenibacillus zeirhizosphaerae TaxID=2987519 RepID=A0ABT9FVI5_9BACL|nr:glycosyltransferase [Paenibacillus sp. P96]MDP4098487.1 glycosyltransferase [Paenibacillus sp. P96]
MIDRTSVYPQMLDCRVLFIPQGFPAVDSGVAGALQRCTKECMVGTPETMLEAAAAFRPDLMLVMNGLHVFPANHLQQVQQIKALGIRTGIWFVDDPYFTEDTSVIALHYDVVFTHELSCVSFYQSLGAANVHYMPLGVDEQIFYPRRVDFQYDVCFIGSAFWNRVELFDQLAPFLADKRVVIVGGHWDRLKRTDVLGKFIRNGWMKPEETVDYYNASKIVLNLHRPSEMGMDNRNTHRQSAMSINPRTYEISACGTLQMTDVRDDLSSHYRPGYDIETFASADELRDKMDYYLRYDRQREHIAWRSLYTTRQNHTYTSRIPKLLSIALS